MGRRDVLRRFEIAWVSQAYFRNRDPRILEKPAQT